MGTRFRRRERNEKRAGGDDMTWHDQAGSSGARPSIGREHGKQTRGSGGQRGRGRAGAGRGGAERRGAELRVVRAVGRVVEYKKPQKKHTLKSAAAFPPSFLPTSFVNHSNDIK